MSEHDPLDDLLHAAFAADAARTPPVHVAERVMARLRRRARVRLLTLAVTLTAGLAVLAASLQPALSALSEVADRMVAGDWTTDPLGYGVVAVLAAWLMLMDRESA